MATKAKKATKKASKTTSKVVAQKAPSRKASAKKTVASKNTVTKKATTKKTMPKKIKATKKTKTTKAAVKTTKKKSTVIKTKKTTTKKAAPTKKAATKKTIKKKAATKKTVAKKAAPIKDKDAGKTASSKTVTAKKKVAPKSKSKAKNTVTVEVLVEQETPISTAQMSVTEEKATTKKAAKKATKKATTKKATAEKETTEKAATKKAATKKAATKKTTTKKATRKRATKKAVREKIVANGKVGQAPRRTADEVAASNPFPVPPQIHEAIEEAPTTPSPEAKEAKKDFKMDDKIVYPAHGVGIIEAIERQEIVGTTIEVFVIRFEHEKLKLRVPTEKAKAVGMRPLSDPAFVEKTIIVLQGRARIKRTMWSRRAQEYEAKINSGDLNAVAEVVRDLYRAPEQPEQSYSERQLFEAALDRMAREVAAVKEIDLSGAIDELDASLQKKVIPVT